MMDNRMHVRTGRSLLQDEKKAVSEFYNMIQQPDPQVVIFFCSSNYDLNILGAELAQYFECPLIGCTTAGEISSHGYQDGGIVGASISSMELKIHRHILYPLSQCSLSEVEKLASCVRTNLSFAKTFNRQKMFGFILIDGLSMLEEATMALLYNCFEGIPIIGGSAGDDLKFKETYIYDNGQFRRDTAVFTIFETTLPFQIFKIQNYEPTDTTIVITGADPEKRIITEINGEAAAPEYARLLGLECSELSPTVFSENPLLLKIGGEWYIRSIQKSNEDQSLTMFSAIEEGLVLTIGKGTDIISQFWDPMPVLEKKTSQNHLMILCDCILRKLEFMNRGIIGEINGMFGGFDTIGFSSYGEQFNSIHINQTLTGVMIGD